MGRPVWVDVAADAKDVAKDVAGAAGDAAADAAVDGDADGGVLVRGVPMAGSVLGKEAAGFQDQGNEAVSGEQRCGALAGRAVLVEPDIGIGVRDGNRGEIGLQPVAHRRL
jgi:hypothetical protein